MIDYEYPEIWYDATTHKTYLMTDGDVTVSGTDYTVANDTITIDNSILDTESVDIRQAINPDFQLYFGSFQSASITFRIYYTGTTLKNKVLKVYLIPNHDASKILQVGVFKVAEDRKVNDEGMRTIVGYDALYDIINTNVNSGSLTTQAWYDQIMFPSTESTCTLLEMRTSFFEYFDIEVEDTELVNDDIVLRPTLHNESISGADILKWLCEINGTLGMITNEGKFRFVTLVNGIKARASLGDESVHEIPFEIVIDGSYEDYEVKNLTGLSIATGEGFMTTRWLSPGGAGTYVITGNALIYDYDNDAIQDLLIPITNQIASRGYQPATVSAVGNPLIEVGDAIKTTLKNGQEIVFYVLERNLHGIQALRDTYTARGEEVWEQDLNSISSRTESGGGGGGGSGGSSIGVSTYTNGRAITVGTSRTKVGQLTFSVSENTTALVACTLLAEVSGVTDTAVLTVWLRINRSWEEYFIPHQTVMNGHHVITINLPVSVAPLDANIIDFYVTMSEGTAYFDVQQIWASVTAAGLESSAEWNGELEIEETYEPFTIGLTLAEYADSVSAATQTPTAAAITETYTPFSIGLTLAEYTDSVSVTLADE